MSFIPMPNDFQVNKLLFFKELKYSQATKVAQWNLYINHVSDIEIEFNKDLYFFEELEIEKYNNNIKNKSKSTINVTNSFIKQYLKWYSAFYKTDAKKFNLISISKIDNSWYINKMDFYKICEKIQKELGVSYILPLLLIRYGISGKQMIFTRTIKWKHIDFELNEVLMRNKEGDVILHIPVDYNFLKWIDIAKSIEIEKNKDYNIDESYIIQNSERNINKDVISYNTLNTKVYQTFKSINMSRIALNSLSNCAKVEYLFRLNKQGYTINGEVVSDLLQSWYPKEICSIGVVYNLKKLFTDLLEDKKV